MYNSRKVMMMLIAMVFSIGAVAQSVQDGIKMYNYEKFQSAERILSPLAATDPLANYYLGLCYIQDGDAAKASATFAKYPEDIANISGNARVAFTNKEVAKGMQIAKDLAAKSRKKEWQAEKYAADAITYTQGGDYNQAIFWYKDVQTKNPDDASTHIGLADALRKIPGGGGDAMTNYESVTEKDAKNSLAFSRIGDLWYEAKNYQSALDNYGKAKDADATNPLPYKALARAFGSSGKYKQGLDNIQKYYDLSDKTPADKINYMEAEFLAQSYCDAVKMSKDMINDITDMEKKTELYGILGFSEAQCGDSLDAIKNIRIWLSRRDKSKILPSDYVNVGKLFLKMGQLDSAVAYYNKGIAGDTGQNKTDIYRQIAEAFKSKKDYCNSAAWYDNLVKANPETQPADYAWRGIMFYYCHDYDKAMKAYNDFAAKYPTQPSIPYWQGRIAEAIDSDATSGAAVPYFMKWFEIIGPNYEKPNEEKGPYEYLIYYFYNKKDKENMNLYKEKLRAIDPNDKALKDLEEMEKAANAPKKQPATKPKK
jgi:tetratricopeptide (TPR) repeat protein